jgi:hypothetical protein
MVASSTSADDRPGNYGDKMVTSNDRKTVEETHCGILDDFHSPAEFGDGVKVRERCHETMRPSVDSNVCAEF